jgi:signal peptidase II
VNPRLLLALTASVTAAADQITKAIALSSLRDGESLPVVDGVLHWTLQRNPGAAFGLFRRAPVLFTVVAIVIATVIVVAAPRVRDGLNAVALGLVLGGALGNLGDRLFRPPGPFRGRVIDFIDFRVWPTFNLADAAVVVGAALLAIASFRAEHREPAQPQP